VHLSRHEISGLGLALLLFDASVGLSQPTIQFASSTYTVAESVGPVTLSVQRQGDLSASVGVSYATTNLTANAGADYTAVSGTLTLATGETNRTLTVPIINNGVVDGNRTFRVVLTDPNGGAVLGTQTHATVSITDNDAGVQFTLSTFSVTESAGAAVIGVARGDDGNHTVTVDYATSDETATSGLDYLGTTNALVFTPGEKVKVVLVPILNDGIKESTETFRAVLNNPTGGAVLGSLQATLVSILDNDPGVGFERSAYSVCEKAGALTLIVLRGNDTALDPFSVDYAASDVTAIAGQDYEAIAGTMQFQANEMVKSLMVPILADPVPEGPEHFRVALSNPSGGATLGTATTTVTIRENTRTVVPPFDSQLSIRREFGVNVLTWTGGGPLQRADRVTGPWQTLSASQGPYPVQAPIPASFYRVGGPRPADVYVPSTYDGRTPLPLVILLHGGGGSGAHTESYFHLQPLAEARGFLYCYPNGSSYAPGGYLWFAFLWNAADASVVGYTYADDAAYLRSLIQEIGRDFPLDRKRIFLVGHSNGGGMADRLAFESADLIAGLASLAGPSKPELGFHRPSEPVSVLHIHGTDDASTRYEGAAGAALGGTPYASAVRSIQLWADYNHASAPVTDLAPSLDLALDGSGLDTVVTRYATFPPGGAVELWTIKGGSHSPQLSASFSPAVLDWLFAHPKP
jgi:poly(3-hydroxybutyrate) depolymerase